MPILFNASSFKLDLIFFFVAIHRRLMRSWQDIENIVLASCVMVVVESNFEADVYLEE